MHVLMHECIKKPSTATNLIVLKSNILHYLLQKFSRLFFELCTIFIITFSLHRVLAIRSALIRDDSVHSALDGVRDARFHDDHVRGNEIRSLLPKPSHDCGCALFRDVKSLISVLYHQFR